MPTTIHTTFIDTSPCSSGPLCESTGSAAARMCETAQLHSARPCYSGGQSERNVSKTSPSCRKYRCDRAPGAVSFLSAVGKCRTPSPGRPQRDRAARSSISLRRCRMRSAKSSSHEFWRGTGLLHEYTLAASPNFTHRSRSWFARSDGVIHVICQLAKPIGRRIWASHPAPRHRGNFNRVTGDQRGRDRRLGGNFSRVHSAILPGSRIARFPVLRTPRLSASARAREDASQAAAPGSSSDSERAAPRTRAPSVR